MKNGILVFVVIFLILQEAVAQSPAYKDTVFTEYFRRTSGWTAADGTLSVPLPDQKSLWLFGDTYLDGYNAADTTIPCLFQLRNSMMVQDLQKPEDFITIIEKTKTGQERTPIKDPDDKDTHFWPGHGYVKGDTAIVFWLGYRNGMEHAGNYVSKIDIPNLTDASNIEELTRLPLKAGVEYGNAVVVDSSDNYIYIYGHKKEMFRLPLVARLSVDQDIKGPWEFYDGKDWNFLEEKAAQIMEHPDQSIGASFSVIKLQGKFYMISQKPGGLKCGYGREIYSWESETPYGPFTNKKLLYTIEDKYKGEYWVTYNATAHPEFIKNNELLISYNVNGFKHQGVGGISCRDECQDPFNNRRHADGYRPKFIRVPLDFIDPDLNVSDRFSSNEQDPESTKFRSDSEDAE